MVKLIIINTAGDFYRAANTLNRMKKRLPAMTILGMRRWGKILEKHMKRSARNAGISDSTGLLQGKGIEWRQGKRSETGHLFMRLYGIYLDSMEPHFVNLTRRRTRLLLWAKMARSPRIRKGAEDVEEGKVRGYSVFVKPHPFIAAGYRSARRKLRPVLKRVAARAIQGS